MSRFVTRGPKKGKCNICGVYGDLTEDHTPPKGAARITQVQVNTLTEILNVDKPTKTSRFSQNGVKFRSLCKDCNNGYLGSNYDVEFSKFSLDVKRYITSDLRLPSVLYVRGKPQKIAKALYGHLMAIGIDQYYESEINSTMKDWFFNEDVGMPGFLSIYYWPYPYQKQILMRNAGYKDLRLKENAHIWLMKFFPIAFLLVWDEPAGYTFSNLENFDRWRDADDDTEAEIPIKLLDIPDEGWPEVPTTHNILAFDSNLAIGAAEVKKKRTKKVSGA